jgi:D-alanyl-D-alanine carboxypeptidase
MLHLIQQKLKPMKALFTPILVFLTLTCAAQFPTNIKDSLQKILEASLPIGTSNPGAVMTINISGEESWSVASGKSLTGTTFGYPATDALATDQFRIGSITKLMVATAILQLEEAGDLTLNDSLSMYLRTSLINDTLQSSATVTIEQLLNHTSGIANSANNQDCQQNALMNLTDFYTLEEAVECGSSQGELFTPGSSWGYSNTNYTLLALIIESITGNELSVFLDQNIFSPLNLENTYVPETNEIDTSHMGCYWNIGPPFGLVDMTIVNPSLYKGWADVVSTTADLTIFLDNLVSGNLISTASLAKIKTTVPASYSYGLGIEFYDVGTEEYYGHSGEVGNTNGLFYSELSTTLIPNGYYIAYNYNYQGVSSLSELDEKVYTYLSSLQPNLTASVQNTLPPEKLTVYPNPNNGVFFIDLANYKKATITIRNLQGQTIEAAPLTSNTLDYSHLEKGIYLLEVKTPNRYLNNKIILN